MEEYMNITFSVPYIKGFEYLRNYDSAFKVVFVRFILMSIVSNGKPYCYSSDYFKSHPLKTTY